MKLNKRQLLIGAGAASALAMTGFNITKLSAKPKDGLQKLWINDELIYERDNPLLQRLKVEFNSITKAVRIRNLPLSVLGRGQLKMHYYENNIYTLTHLVLIQTGGLIETKKDLLAVPHVTYSYHTDVLAMPQWSAV